MTRILLFIKHRLPKLWCFVEWLNSMLFRLIHRDRVSSAASVVLREFALEGFTFRKIGSKDLDELSGLLRRQTSNRMAHFQPHAFDLGSLRQVNENPAFLMFGVFSNNSLVGYFFLRCFWNRRSFVGRLIDENFERRGIGRVMNNILYNTAWRAGFRCHTTISKNNSLVMRSHRNNPNFRILKELPNNYLLVEFEQTESQD